MGLGQRELRAVLKTLQRREHFFSKAPRHVFWVTDSQNRHSFLKRGSKKVHIQRDDIKIKKLETRLGIRVSPIWKPREYELIVMADEGSKKYKSTDEWSVDRSTLEYIQRRMKTTCTVDGIAMSENKCMSKFFF